MHSPRGFTLIELMVAMLLGLVIIAGVISVFLANQQVYRTNSALDEVQNETRIAFELMARDVRDAGLTGCLNNGRISNVLKNGPNNGGTDWWANWNNTLVGFTGTQTDAAAPVGTANTQKVTGTDSIQLIGGEDSGYSVASDAEPAGTFTLNEKTSDLASGSIVIVCNPDHAAVMQINSYNGGSGSTITFTHATSGSPGNCTTDLSYPTVCSSTNSYVYVANSQIAALSAVDWYVGYNSVGGGSTSLFRTSLQLSATGVPTPTPVEMVRNVKSMTIKYLQSGGSSYVLASAVTNWAAVTAVQVTLNVQSTNQRAGTNTAPLTRTFTSTTTVRNRVQ
jgi:type IV pilus assembly protein PilW